MRTLLVVGLLVATAIVPRARVALDSETAHLIVATPAIKQPAAPGSRVTLTVHITPKSKMHVYSPQQPDVIPISLKLNPGPFKALPVVLPVPEKFFFAPLDETQLVYSKPFKIQQPVTIAATARGTAPSIVITGTLEYQACDDAICYIPARVPVSWTIPLKP
jgi:cytochrome c biogenesis DsbD-like protein